VARYKEVELNDGRVVHVFRPPTQQILALVKQRYPEPMPPEITEKKVTGGDITMIIEDDPAYLAEHDRWEDVVNEEVDRRGALFVFDDLEVPDDWDAEREVGDRLRAAGDTEWKPADGPLGRKFDYIQWSILGDIENAVLILEAQAELSGVPVPEVQANLASFRPEVEGETD
jgi:hypothetical protein